ncbi:hypothetical protein POM88_042788 [Heracleum sosnowskyi]|uniref:Uncharacterized protein n=1 Tax=Heracleum sosnowskyi TaxID=360622 RepID=A0AAD8HJ97_9APIA|nr:hypothetical protein POM88_042788 [Heracleum sosnowskyi]
MNKVNKMTLNYHKDQSFEDENSSNSKLIHQVKGFLFGIVPVSSPDDMFLQFVNRKKDLLPRPPGPRFGQFNTFVKERLSFNIQRKIPILDAYVRDLMKFSESLKFNVRQLSNVMDEIEEIVRLDPRVAEVVLEPVVLERIVKILREIDDKHIKVTAAYILSASRLDKCNAVIINKAIQYLVDLMHDDYTVLRAMYTLISLARAYPGHASVIVEKNALNVALDVFTNYGEGYETLNCVGNFMVMVCQVKLSPDEERVALTILDKIIQVEHRYHYHIVRACDALQYLSFKKHVELEEHAFKRQIALIFHNNDEVASSALGVVGNIARWGRDDQLQILAKDSKFLQYLGKTMTCQPKEFLYKEVCQIISEIAAAQDGAFIQALEEAGLIDNLCSLLEVAKFDVKMEAAWDGLEKWRKPTAESIKINTDVAMFAETGCYSLAFVARDFNGELVWARACCGAGLTQPEVAEAIGLKEALSWSKQQLGQQHIISLRQIP